MNKLHMCTGCGCQVLEKPSETKVCPECKAEKLLEVTVYGESTIKKDTVVPGYGRAKFIMSIEAAQDMKVIELEMEAYKASEPSEEEIAFWKQLEDRHYFGKIRTKAPTEEEMAEWREWDKFFAKLDLDAVKKHYKVKILREEEYSGIAIDTADCEQAKMFNGGEPFPEI